ncbi:MAG: hypothetical protein RR184_00945 [Citrobacter sp.]|uniref:hypothetical protein n=1 Tax=Citrobacter sp. TaxID=1896336 RepID=UPI002FC80EA7
MAGCALPASGYSLRPLRAGSHRLGHCSPDKPVRFQELVWNEDLQDLVDLPHKWVDSPYTGAEFDGWSPDEVACAICE